MREGEGRLCRFSRRAGPPLELETPYAWRTTARGADRGRGHGGADDRRVPGARLRRLTWPMHENLAAREGRGRAARIAVISGSPAPDSRTWSFAAVVAGRLEAQAFEVEMIDLGALPPAEVLRGPGDAGPVR